MKFPRFVRKDRFYGFLGKEAALARTGAQAVWTFASDGSNAEQLTDVVERLEEEGGVAAAELEDLLSRSLSTPIDKDDLHRLSSTMALVLDRTTHVAHSCSLLGRTPAIESLAEKHLRCTEMMEPAMLELERNAYGDVSVAAREIRAICKDALQPAPREEPSDPRELLLETDVFARFTELFRVCRAASEVLSYIAVKHA